MNSHRQSEEPRLIIVGDYLFDPREGSLSGPTGAHHLCPRMSALLVRLAESPCRTVPREELTDELWADEPRPSSSLTRCVGRLRQHFGDTAQVGNYIETVPRRGYRLVAPVYGSTRKAVLPRHAVMVSQHEGSRLYRLLREFRERKVCRAMLVYSIVVWLVLQVEEIVRPALNLPEWVDSLVVVLGILGFPIAATLAWIFDLTPNGLVREVRVPAAGVVPAPARNRTDFVFDAVLVAAALAVCTMLVFSSTDSSLVPLSEAGASETVELVTDAEETGRAIPSCGLERLTQAQ
jgi:DNA-binding winged helix-turn-helix (wHTH) protein